MPLPASAVGRKHLHTRTVTCQGFEREDGLWDVDGWMTDVKTFDFDNKDRGGIKAGEPLHGMGLRVTFSDNMTIVDAVAVTDFSPFRICPDITPKFKELIGMRMVAGFNRAVKEKFGGTRGCTHLMELLGPIATTAFQTSAGKRWRQLRKDQKDPATQRPPPIMDSCHAWASDNVIVEREFPKFYTGPKKEPAAGTQG
ncbi:MAG: DUF2889 domain-containing protein [Rhodospirillaceae bacterium]|nr:DUF2889 domain-containing protein [Rhodospirillaceae bacterium]